MAGLCVTAAKFRKLENEGTPTLAPTGREEYGSTAGFRFACFFGKGFLTPDPRPGG